MSFTFVRFIIVGISNTIIGLSVMYFLLNAAGLSYWTSTFLGNSVGACISFFLNRVFTFRSDQFGFESVFRFIVVILFCYFISFNIGKYLVEWLINKHLSFLSDITTDLQVLASTCLYTALNYVLQKVYVFPMKESQKLRNTI
jgi:putative flippase GtrA